MEDCIFCKIIRKEISTTIIYEDEHVLVFPDLHPVKPVHYLVIPKIHVEELIKVENPELFSQIGTVIQKMIAQSGLTDKGYKVSVNGGGHQEVNHLHFHLTGPMGSMA